MPPCKQAHGLTPHGWVHTKDGKPCKHMNAAHAALLGSGEKVNTPRQDALNDQMLDLIRIAEREGLYDAADWIKARWNMPRYSRMSEAAMKAALPNPDDL